VIINPSFIERALDAALSTGADFAEIFIEDTYLSNLTYLSQNADQTIVGTLFGAGIRLFFGHEVIYVTTNDLTKEGLVRAGQLAASVKGDDATLITRVGFMPYHFDSIHNFGLKPWDRIKEEKFRWLKNLDIESRSHSLLVTQVEACLNEKFQKVQIANSLGTLVYDERAYSRISVEAFVESEGKIESSIVREGHMGTSEIFEALDFGQVTGQNVKRAETLLGASYAPAGEMPVIIDNAFGGVIFHEACGHGLETTSVAIGASVFCGKLGQKVADECVTAIDDGTIPNGWGSLNIDDEGTPTQRTVLIEKGILKSYIVDHMGARQTGYQVTGSGRRQSYKFAPASRMRNTFIAPGTDSFESMVREVDFGLFAKTMGGGSVNPGTGDFNFAVQEAYLIRKGEIAEPVKGASLIGRGIEALGKIKKVSRDLKLSTGMCGSVSGSIPAAVGQPQILVSSLIVGGRA